MAKVSVIIPIYNVEKYLRECLESVINQTLKDIEIICVDDGSPDNCPRICDEYAAKDARIKVIHKGNGGYGSAMNVGLDNATGEYIGIVEPDDYIESNMYEDLYKIAQKFDSDIVKSAYWEIFEDEENNKIRAYSYWAHEIKMPEKSFKIQDCPNFFYHHPSIWSCIYKRNFINAHNIKFVEAQGGGWVDNPFQVVTFCLAEKINWSPFAYYNYRPQSIGNSSNLKDYKIPVARFNEIHDFFDEHQDIYQAVFPDITRKEIAYLYNAFKIGFKYATNSSDIRILEKDIKAICARIPKIDKTVNIDNAHRKWLKKMKSTNYTIRYLKQKVWK